MRKTKPCFLVLESDWSEDLRERESAEPFVKGLCDLVPTGNQIPSAHRCSSDDVSCSWNEEQES